MQPSGPEAEVGRCQTVVQMVLQSVREEVPLCALVRWPSVITEEAAPTSLAPEASRLVVQGAVPPPLGAAAAAAGLAAAAAAA